MHAIRLEIVHISGKFAATICISVSANSFTEKTTERTDPLVVTLMWTKIWQVQIVDSSSATHSEPWTDLFSHDTSRMSTLIIRPMQDRMSSVYMYLVIRKRCTRYPACDLSWTQTWLAAVPTGCSWTLTDYGFWQTIYHCMQWILKWQ